MADPTAGGNLDLRKCHGLDLEPLRIARQPGVERCNRFRTTLLRARQMQSIARFQGIGSPKGERRRPMKAQRSQRKQCQIIVDQPPEPLPRLVRFGSLQLTGALLDAQSAGELGDAPMRGHQLAARSAIPFLHRGASRLRHDECDENARIEIDHAGAAPSVSRRFAQRVDDGRAHWKGGAGPTEFDGERATAPAGRPHSERAVRHDVGMHRVTLSKPKLAHHRGRNAKREAVAPLGDLQIHELALCIYINDDTF